MNEEKLYTIDELMEGKEPGKVKVTRGAFKEDDYFIQTPRRNALRD